MAKFKVVVDGQVAVSYDGPTAMADALASFEKYANEGDFKDSVELLKVLATATHGVKVVKTTRQRNGKPNKARVKKGKAKDAQA